jgi:hypothetical protein
VNKIRPGLVPIYSGFRPSARDRCGLKSHTFFPCDPMPFPSRIRDRGVFPQWCLELEVRLCLSVAGRTEGVGRASAGRTRWRGGAGSAGPIPK